MKFAQGAMIEINQQSVSTQFLMEAGMKDPDFLPTIMRTYRPSSPLNYILDVKGMKTKGLNESTNTKRYTTVSSNHVRYRLDEDDLLVRHFKANAAGLSFESDYSDEPGKGGSTFIAYTDSNHDGFQEVIELGDNETYLYNLIDPEEVGDGVYKHEYKLVTNDKTDFVSPDLLYDGSEYVTRYNIHEQDFSERGVEKYQFKNWSDAYLSLQRFKYSWSGTAKAILKNKGKITGKFVYNNKGGTAFLSEMEINMMKRVTEQLNYAHVFGKKTVADDGTVFLKNKKGRDILAGDGIFYSNGGPLRYQYNGWTREFMNYLMQEIDQYVNQNHDNHTEVVMLMAPKAYSDFQTLMGLLGKTHNNNIVGDGASKGFVDTYGYYELAGIRLIPMKEPSMTNRPRRQDDYGEFENDMDVILLPLGLTTGGNNGVELIQLRSMIKGTVSGIDAEGNISSSVDGSSTHVLLQNGIVNQNKVIFLRKYRLAS